MGTGAGRRRQRLALREVRGHRVDRSALAQRRRGGGSASRGGGRGSSRGGRATGRSGGRRARRLGPGQLAGVAAEVAPGRGVEAHRVAAEGRVGRVEAEHLLLRERQRQPERQHRLDRLLDDRARPALPGEAHDLHGERAAPAHHPSPPEVGGGGPGEGQRVDTRVPVEAAVLEAGDRRPELLRHRLRDAEAPLAVRGDRRAEQLAVAVEDHGRERVVERHHRHEGPERQQRGSAAAAQKARCAGVRPEPHATGPASPLRPTAPSTRALRVASYIASAVTIGR